MLPGSTLTLLFCLVLPYLSGVAPFAPADSVAATAFFAAPHQVARETLRAQGQDLPSDMLALLPEGVEVVWAVSGLTDKLHGEDGLPGLYVDVISVGPDERIYPPGWNRPSMLFELEGEITIEYWGEGDQIVETQLLSEGEGIILEHNGPTWIQNVGSRCALVLQLSVQTQQGAGLASDTAGPQIPECETKAESLFYSGLMTLPDGQGTLYMAEVMWSPGMTVGGHRAEGPYGVLVLSGTVDVAAEGPSNRFLVDAERQIIEGTTRYQVGEGNGLGVPRGTVVELSAAQSSPVRALILGAAPPRAGSSQ